MADRKSLQGLSNRNNFKKHFTQICQVQEVVWPNSWSGFFIQMFSDLNHNFINVILHTLLLYFIQIKILYGCLG